MLTGNIWSGVGDRTSQVSKDANHCNESATHFGRRARAGREPGAETRSWPIERGAQYREQRSILLTVEAKGMLKRDSTPKSGRENSRPCMNSSNLGLDCRGCGFSEHAVDTDGMGVLNDGSASHEGKDTSSSSSSHRTKLEGLDAGYLQPTPRFRHLVHIGTCLSHFRFAAAQVWHALVSSPPRTIIGDDI